MNAVRYILPLLLCLSVGLAHGQDDFYHKYRLAVGGGLNQSFKRLRDVPDDRLQHYRDLRQGIDFNGEFTLFLSPSFGLGVYYHYFGAEQTTDVTATLPGDGGNVPAVLDESLRKDFFGYHITYRLYSANNKAAWFLGMGIGSALYQRKIKELAERKERGAAIGLTFRAGADYYLSENVGLGIALHFNMGSVRQLKITEDGGTYTQTLNPREFESLTYIGVSAGIRLLK